LVEQPIRNRQVSGSSPLVGSILQKLRNQSPQPAAHLLHKQFSLPVASSPQSPLGHRLDVAPLRRLNVFVAQDRLDHLVGYTEFDADMYGRFQGTS
jgi:hypothetical protein